MAKTAWQLFLRHLPSTRKLFAVAGSGAPIFSKSYTIRCFYFFTTASARFFTSEDNHIPSVLLVIAKFTAIGFSVNHNKTLTLDGFTAPFTGDAYCYVAHGTSPWLYCQDYYTT